jgi:hypothetical protein
MWEDPIVAEVHRIRAQIAAECNYDIDTFFKRIMERQAAMGVKLVPPPPRPARPVEDESNDVSVTAPAA